MKTNPPASLLVAALVMLRHPCARNQATAQLLLERAAEHTALTPAEREACRELADTLDREYPELKPMRPRAAPALPTASTGGTATPASTTRPCPSHEHHIDTDSAASAARGTC